MSRSYEVHWSVDDVTGAESEKMVEDLFDPEGIQGNHWSPLVVGQGRGLGHWEGYGDLNLGGGKSPDEYAGEVVEDLFELLGREVPVDFHVTYIEQAPTDTFSFGRQDGDNGC